MKNIATMMSESGLLDLAEVKRVAAAQGNPEQLHKVAIKTGLIAEETFLNFASQTLNLPIITELDQDFDPKQVEVTPAFMEEHVFIPIKMERQSLHLALNDPFDFIIFENLKQLYPGLHFQMALAKEEHIKKWIEENFAPDIDSPAHRDDETEDDLSDLIVSEDLEQLRDLASEAPVIKKVNFYLTKAVESGVSDIHIEPFYDRVQVRFRIDGILKEFDTIPKNLQQAVTTRIKIMSKLDISERRMPQDGRIKIKIAGRSIDLRVSCLPAMYGESVVMRILDRENISFSLDTLGFPEVEYSLFKDLIQYPYGILLVTGPTGSGKTTTLYSALNTINSPEKKIITIEDPVEYELDGINQVQINPKAGLYFSNGLRSIVRQDPDVLLIGEIRDRETADIAVHSALTGHLVFSTLHTNDSSGAITRLIEMGVEDYLLSSSLLAIMAQRLIRVLCPACKQAFVPREETLDKLELPFQPDQTATLYRPTGCSACNFSGYRGRTAIVEILKVSEDIKELILQNKSSVAIRNMALQSGMRLLQTNGWHKVSQGETSLAEIIRTTGSG